MKYIVCISLLLFFFFSLRTADGLTMSNSRWILQFGNLNSGAGTPSNANYKLGVTIGQTAAGLFTGTNYKVRSGFQYIKTIIPFSFSISSRLIDFGELTASTPVTRTNTLTISHGSAFGYTVTASESSQLLSPGIGSVIPDTTCDGGTCTQTTAALWSNPLTYGFGYRCDNLVGTDCDSGFSTANYYKQFADASAQETPGTVMTGTGVSRNKQAQITYKVNISNTQPAGQYRNVVSFIATPGF